MSKKPYFSEGDYVFYNNPGHSWHMMMFQLIRIVPMTMMDPGGYMLAFGDRDILAAVSQVLHREDPSVKDMVLSPKGCPVVLTANKDKQVNLKSHEGHAVVENYAGGKAFKYCRNCKVEVFE